MPLLPPAYFLLAIVLMAVLHFLAPVVQWIPAPWNLSGAIPLAAGVVLAAVANRLFARRGTPIHPFAAPSALVVAGPFKLTRNPMYLGLTLALIGIAMLLGSLTPWPVIPLFVWIMTTRFIHMEERSLEEQFGDDYRKYKEQVRRWI